jgi:hypothetical protein
MTERYGAKCSTCHGVRSGWPGAICSSLAGGA